jgi:hypothetical protein
MISEYAVNRPQILCKPVEVPTFHTTEKIAVESALYYCLARI